MIETLIAKYYAQISCLQITDGGFISHIRVRDLPFEICKLLKNHRMLVNLRWLDIFLFTLVNVRVIVSHPVIKSNFSLGSGEKESISARSNSLYQSLKFSLISNVPFRDLCRWEPVNFIRVSSKASDSQVKATMNGIIIWKPREYGRRTLQFPSVWAFSFPVAVSTKVLPSAWSDNYNNREEPLYDMRPRRWTSHFDVFRGTWNKKTGPTTDRHIDVAKGQTRPMTTGVGNYSLSRIAGNVSASG